MNIKDRCAIVGIGQTKMGRVPGVDAVGLHVEAGIKAIEDAGLKKEDIDGLLVHPRGAQEGAIPSLVPQYLGLNLRYFMAMTIFGATNIAMVQHAAMAIEAGLCNVVLCTFAENELSARPGPGPLRRGVGGDTVYGMYGAAAGHAMAFRRHQHLYGTTSDHLGAIAVAFRKHACLNPDAQMYGRPITMEDYHNSRWVVEPFHLLDCCLISDGGAAVVVTSAERARELKHRPVYIMGMGQGFNTKSLDNPTQYTELAAGRSAETAYRMAGVTPKDIDTAQLYDCFTYTVLLELEDYGFCKKGEGGPFVEGGRIELGGELPCNTAGGLLSEGYMQGMLHVAEGVRQLRGEAGARQVPDAEIALVSGHGGNLSTHSTLILRR